MKEIPMLYSTPMVQATIEDRKTKTRRTRGLEKLNEWPNRYIFDTFYYEGDVLYARFRDTAAASLDHVVDIKCPYGKPGDVLWVRESWDVRQYPVAPEGDHDELLWFYKATEKEYTDMKWRPSIHMPKVAARIWLEVTDVRVERLQDISEADAIAEGVIPISGINLVVDEDSGEEAKGNGQLYKHYLKNTHACIWPSESFQSLWQSINGEESWNANPWVWVISFKVLSTTGKPVLK